MEGKEKGRRLRRTLGQTEASAQILDNISVLMCWNIKTKSSGFYGNSETEFFLHDDRFKLELAPSNAFKVHHLCKAASLAEKVREKLMNIINMSCRLFKFKQMNDSLCRETQNSIQLQRRHPPVFLPRGPLTARSGCVHHEGPHTGRPRDGQPVKPKEDTKSERHHKQAAHISLITAALRLFSHSISLAELLLKRRSSKELRNV